MKEGLRTWNKAKYKHLDRELYHIRSNLMDSCDVGKDTQISKQLDKEFLSDFRLQESFWKKKACEDSAMLGDKNTQFFYQKAQKKRRWCQLHTLDNVCR